jgi:hypothetical protein
MEPTVIYAATALSLVLCVVVVAVVVRAAGRFSAELVGGVGALGETLTAVEHELHAARSRLEDLQAPNALITRITELEAKVQTAQLVVADGVEKITSLANRQQARDSRAARRAHNLLDDEDEAEEPVTEAERKQALAALAGAHTETEPAGGGNGETRRVGSGGWDRVRRKRAAAGAGGE